MISLADIFLDRLFWLGILETSARSDWRAKDVGSRVVIRRRLTCACHPDGAILVVSPALADKLLALPEDTASEYLSRFMSANTVLLIFARCVGFPSRLKKMLHRHHLPAATSSFAEPLLVSRLKAVIGEKIKYRVAVHGVALELERCGVLITGASGTGKTTAALQSVAEEGAWIADDLVVVSRKKDGNLYLSGHRKIKKYVHCRPSGIMAIENVLDKKRIQDKTRLAAVVNVVRTDKRKSNTSFSEADMMDVSFPFVTITISTTGYLNKNLLRNAVRTLTGFSY